MTTQATALSILDDLILVRLAVGKRPPRMAKFRSDIQSLLKQPINGERWDTSLQELAALGLLTVKPFRATEAGRQRALAFLQVEALPARADWRGLKDQLLVFRALDAGPTDTALREKLKKPTGLAAVLIHRRFDLPAQVPLTPAKVVEALACQLICRELGLNWDSPDVASALSTLSKLAKQLPNLLAGATRATATDLRTAVIRDWLATVERENGAGTLTDTPRQEPTAQPVQAEAPKALEMDAADFAAAVTATALTSPDGHWGNNKVFINRVWRQFQHEPNLPRFDLETFKQRLVEANQHGLLKLERADLVEAMNPDDVRESETTHLNATYHFILIERDRP